MIMSVLTAPPPDWRFSQVSGERCAGEEVHEVKIIVDCVVNYGMDRSSSSRVFEKSLEIARSQSFSSRLKLLLLSVKQLLLPTVGEDMDSTNPYSMSANFVDLLNSQQESVVPEPCPYASFQHVGSSQLPETASFCEDSTTERREMKKWAVRDDLVLISAWLNTSKDPVVGNEQKAGAFWSRIEAYFAASPKVERGATREAIQCKQRWQKMNDLVCKFCGSNAAATRQKTSGQNEADTAKLAHEIFYNDHKIKFNLHHAWEELRNDQKWCEVASSKIDGTSKKRKCDDKVQSESSKQRPLSVINAPNALLVLSRRKEPLTMWSIKEKDMAAKEKLKKIGLLESRICKKEPLSEYEEELKKKLISEMLEI
ncbi:PREDICTED: glutathione S-transferase T3-like [Brassica oleracea var. oleracea]|uniref:glutathione S-transferase T3-like n=1 Tax=Brassica oleracea var. oleracea TaxID=109376 RepID=UPI0006A74F94|nr:PREDICTED: glutathione S-transferase T3-like [Brassica oleracea var. oleracea]